MSGLFDIITAEHIKSLITVVGMVSITLVLWMCFWAMRNPELSARVAEKFIDVPKRFLKIIDRIVDLIEKCKKRN